MTDKLAAYQAEAEACENADQINTLLDKMKKEKSVGDLRLRLSHLVNDRATALGLKLNKEKRYE